MIQIMSHYRDPQIQMAENLKCLINLSHNIGLYTLRRWTKVKPILIQRLVSVGHDVSTRAFNLEVPGSKAGRPDNCHRGCAYTVIQTVQRLGVYSAVYGTVHYKEPLKSFRIE